MEWRTIVASPNYSVSDQGQVQNMKYARHLKPMSGTNGRTHITLPINGKFMAREIHVLVCEAFHGPRPQGLEVSHIDGDLTNNAANNLCWETRSENLVRRIGHGTMDRDFDNSRASLTPESRDQVFALRLTGLTQSEIGLKLGVSQTTIYRVLNGKRYAA
jgi:hypothetical protein